MSWYDKGSSALDFSKPIKAVKGLDVYLLMPIRNNRDYTVTYEWFSPIRGIWNSSVGWKTPNEPVESYVKMGYTVTNTEITLS